jgi:hypothetical protein
MRKELSEFTTEQLNRELDRRQVNERIKEIIDSGTVTDYSITTDCWSGGISVSFDINGGA